MPDFEELRKKPFLLDDAALAWVRKTFGAMTLQEKAEQVFCCEVRASDAACVERVTGRHKIGAVMCLPGTADDTRRLIEKLQAASKIPMLAAGNLEEGADVVREGTNLANNLEIGAAGDAALAGKMGEITAAEAKSIGIRWAFAPVVDIGMNWRNPVIATRVFGSNPDFVAAAGQAFVRGLQAGGVAAALKHFPGDGVDERDQHFHPSVNSLSWEQWDETYGKVYQACIEAGALTVMVGHILQPAWAKKINPALSEEEILPASTSRELIGGLLRQHLGFGGLVATDSTTMTGFDQILPREKAIPTAIAAGCDLLLFTENMEEDIAFLRQGIDGGIVSKERLDDAVLHVLALKAALGLAAPEQPADAERHVCLPSAEGAAFEKQCAHRAVTLVKDRKHLLPVSPQKHRRVYLIAYAEGRGFGSTSEQVYALLKTKLEERGFQVICHGGGQPPLYGPHAAMKAQFDLILYAANLNSVSNNTVCRLNWGTSMGREAPNFLSEIPTVFVSFGNPYHLVDVPRMPTFINAYKFKESVVDAVLDKMTGREPFCGINPVDPFCGFPDTRL